MCCDVNYKVKISSIFCCCAFSVLTSPKYNIKRYIFHFIRFLRSMRRLICKRTNFALMYKHFATDQESEPDTNQMLSCFHHGAHPRGKLGVELAFEERHVPIIAVCGGLHAHTPSLSIRLGRLLSRRARSLHTSCRAFFSALSILATSCTTYRQTTALASSLGTLVIAVMQSRTHLVSTTDAECRCLQSSSLRGRDTSALRQ